MILRRSKRELSLADLPEMLEIIKAYPTLGWNQTLLESSLRHPDQLGWGLISATGKLISFAWFQQVLDEAELLLIATHPAHVQRGAARQLLVETEACLRERGVNTFFLEVRVSNLAAQRLYAALGFLPLALRENYYQLPSEDALVFQKKL
jgi:ribosomal-protein-alanine N-acetyltransferase